MRTISPFEAEVLREILAVGEVYLPDYDRNFNSAVSALHRSKFVSYSYHKHSDSASSGYHVSVTPFGEDALALFEDQADQQARADAQQQADALQRKNDKRKAFQRDLAIIFFTAAVTCIFDHINDVINFFDELLHWLSGK